MSEKLLPCPMCGSAPYLNRDGDRYVICGGCGTEGPWFEHDEAEAIAAWNQRTRPDELIEALRACAERWLDARDIAKAALAKWDKP